MITTPYARIRALVIDDDPWALRLMRGMLRECFPMLHVETRTTPDAAGEHHVYFVDNDFSGHPEAERLAAEIRAAHPSALIIAFSATLDAPTLKRLLNSGCDGVCDKSDLSDLPRVMEITQRFIEATCDPRADADRGGGFMDAVRAVRGLLSEWNARLEHEEEHARD